MTTPPTPDFLTFVANLPDAEVGEMANWLVRNEKDYLVALGELTKFRPVYLKTKVNASQHLKWFRKYSAQSAAFAPIWMMAYGVGVLAPIEEAALAKLPIKLRDELGYEPKNPEALPTSAQFVTFLKEAEEAFGLARARQWGNICLLIMEPTAKEPIHEALTALGWNLCTPETADADTSPAAA
ncbi:MAG: hypothetical protein GEEBNDBF_00033 [bacterium]|nr:hypothetical protein [bacterium]